MKRKIYQDMLRWKHERKGDVALLIEGARRIGKSYIVEEFARNEYDSYLLIDFSKVSPQVLDFFNIYLDDLNTLFLNLEIYFKRKLTHEILTRRRRTPLSSSMKCSSVPAHALPSSIW